MASIDKMIRALADENISLENESTGQSISTFDKSLRHTLGYNRESALETFKKAYYFLLEKSEGKLSKKKLEIAKRLSQLQMLSTCFHSLKPI